MKYFLLIFPLFFCFNIGFTQNNSLNRIENFQLTLQPSATTNDFISQKIQLPTQSEAPFFTIAAFVDHPFSGQLQYKIADQNWQRLLPYHEANHPDRTIYELLFLPNKTTTLQFKSDQSLPAELSVRWLVLSATGSIDYPLATPREDCNCSQPTICGRDCWCPAGDCPTDATPVATAPSHIIIHHSASASASDDFPAVVRSYWDFHVNVNGWDDIGYNWLIDGEGVIYEGRGSGTQGAHFSCMNNETTGICMIGNFENTTPTPTAIDALEEMIAWEACDKSINPSGSSNHVTSGSLLAHISGHRDGNDLPNSCTNTVCPGENLYPLLPTIRERVTDKACLNDLVATEETDRPPLQIFPNPSDGRIQLSGELSQIAEVVVFSPAGQQVPFNFTADGQLEIHDSGLYILKIISKDGAIISRKLLVRP